MRHRRGGSVARSARTFRRTVQQCLAILSLGLVIPAVSGAATYVDRDSRGGGCNDARTVEQASDPSTPWCSLPRAVAAAPSGSLVLVRAGSYPALAVSNNHTRSVNVTFRRYGTEDVALAGVSTLNTEYLRFEGLRITGLVNIDHGSHHIEVVDNRIVPSGTTTPSSFGVIIQDGTRDILVERNHITAPQGSGVHLSSGVNEPAISNVTIRGNHFENIGQDGVQVSNFVNVLIEDNEFEGVHSRDGVAHPDVIVSFAGGSGLVVRGNNLHDNTAQGLFIKDGAVSDVVVENNLISRTVGGFKAFNVYNVDNLKLINNTVLDGSVFQGTVTKVSMLNNIFASLSTSGSVQFDVEDYNYIAAGNLPGSGSHDLRTGVSFVDAASNDYRLAPGSAGIDAGTNNAAPVLDRLANARVDDPNTPNTTSYFDMGAHEFATGAAVANQPPSASFTYSCSKLACSFDGSTSKDSDGAIATYTWSLGAGTSMTGAKAQYTYGSGGTYTVTLTVIDDRGASATVSQKVTVTAGATMSLSASPYKIKGFQHVALKWSGATSSKVDIWRNGKIVSITANDGAHTDKTGMKGSGTHTYNVCEAGTSTCSANVTATF